MSCNLSSKFWHRHNLKNKRVVCAYSILSLFTEEAQFLAAVIVTYVVCLTPEWKTEHEM